MPLDWIAHQFFYDCVRTRTIEEDIVRIGFAHQPEHAEIVNFDFFCVLDDVIRKVLFEWWLSDLAFSFEYEEFQEYSAAIKDWIVWDQIDFWEVWHSTGSDQGLQEISKYEEAQDKMMAKLEALEAAIEAQAVRIGL